MPTYRLGDLKYCNLRYATGKRYYRRCKCSDFEILS